MLHLKLHPGRLPAAFLAGFLLLAVWMTACTPPPENQSEPERTIPSATRAPATPVMIQDTPTPLPSQTAVTGNLPANPPTQTPTPIKDAACQGAAGEIETQSITTRLLDQSLDFRVYLPACYARQTDRRFPVIYLLHGQTYTDDQWVRLGITTLADRLIASGVIPPFLIVMPYDRDWRQPDESHFGQALTEVLVPWIDSHYRTIPDRTSRAIGGVSRGAAWAVHLGLLHWDLFGAIGAHSLPIFWSDSDQIGRWLDAIPSSAMPRIYIDISKNDADLSSAVDFEALLNARGIPHEWYLRPGYHNEAYWQAHLEEYLRWYVADW